MATEETRSRLSPAISVDESGQVIVDIPRLLRLAGWEDTEVNRDKMLKIARKACAAARPLVTQIVTPNHECFKCHTKWQHEGPGCGQPRVTAYCTRCMNR
jgi:hypothetical protein